MRAKLTDTDISDLDKQIETLLECKPLKELEVKLLCDKVKTLKAVGFTEDLKVDFFSKNSIYNFPSHNDIWQEN